MFYANAYNENDELIMKIPVETTESDGVLTAVIKKENIPAETHNLDFMTEYGNAEETEIGYMVSPRGDPEENINYALCRFKKQEDNEFIVHDSAIALFGVKKEDMCFAAIVTGMRCDYDTVVGVKNGVHYIYPRFKLDGDGAYEDVSVEYHTLTGKDANYSGMARRYRKYQLDRGACVPLKERARNNEYLDYAANAINIRIRMGMKPIPTPVLEQTPETEPEMVACCTFDRLKDLITEFKKQGVEKAEFCLIGWNLKGHDGRFPDTFPVEPQLGGEEKLREVIKYGQENGYQMTCHTNSTDAYTIASMWNEDDIIRLKDGSLSIDPHAWSGGRMYRLCPAVAYEQAKAILPQVADLGFKGVHYIDVISVHCPRKCYSDKHPLNRKQAVEVNDKLMTLSKELFGGFSSEGAYDVNIGNLDFALLVHYNTMGKQHPMCDRVIPLWELVYHGITLHNTSWEPIGYNSPTSEDSYEANEKRRLKNIEFGGRPVPYFTSAFRGTHETLGIGYSPETDELIQKSVSALKTVYEDYKELSFLQYEFMENHEEISDGVFETTYSDGSKIIVDYNKLDWKLIRG